MDMTYRHVSYGNEDDSIVIVTALNTPINDKFVTLMNFRLCVQVLPVIITPWPNEH